MSIARTYQRLLAPIKRRIANMINRAEITAVNTSEAITRLQVTTKAGQPHDGVKYFEPYGFTGTPLVGAEVLLLTLGGFRVALCAVDRRYRITGTAEGDVVVHDLRGQKITLSTAGVEVETTLALTVKAASAAFDCDITSTGNISDSKGSMDEMRSVFNDHTQSVSGSTAAAPATKME